LDAQPPKVAGIRAGPALTAVLYLLLAGSAALALWARGNPGQEAAIFQLAPWAFLAFVAAFAVYRFALVRAGRYPAFKAFFQVVAGIIFFTLLLPQSWPAQKPPPPGVEEPLGSLLSDPNVRVRRLAAEVARQRALSRDDARALVGALTDPDADVRLQAHKSLVDITSEDLGSPESADAVRAWKDRYQ
jgi:hypothetical protein